MATTEVTRPTETPRDANDEQPTLANLLAALQDDADDERTIEDLARLAESLDRARLGSEPIRLLEAARAGHEARNEHRASAMLIELELRLVVDDPELTAALAKELGRLSRDELLDDAVAVTAFRRALEGRPGDVELGEWLEQAEQVAANWKEIAKRFIEEAEGANDPQLRASLFVRAATLLYQYKKKSRDKEVDRFFKSALEADPSSLRAIRLFAETLRARKRWSELAELLETHAPLVRSRTDRLAFLVRAARTRARRADDRDGAARAYAQALDLQPGHEEALGYLVEHFTAREQWDELVALYEEALRVRQRPEAERGILLQIAMVHFRFRGRADQAEPYFARLRKLDPLHPGVLAFYRELYGRPDDASKLLAILSEAQRVATDASAKLGLSEEVARVAERTPGSFERAIEAWKTVERLAPQHPEARAALHRLYRHGEKWNALVELLRGELEALPRDDAAGRTPILREMVEVYRDRLGLDAMVVQTYGTLLQLVPDDLDALDALASAYESMGRFGDLVQVLARRADATPDPLERVDLLRRVSRLWIDRFANYNQATRPLELILELDPSDVDAIIQLKDIYAKKRAWKPLFDVLAREEALSTGLEAKRAVVLERAKLAAERLQQPAAAIELYRSLVESDPALPEAMDALERLSERERDLEALVFVLERRSRSATDDADRVKALTKLAIVHGEQRSDGAGAASAWRRILEIDPKNGRALRALRETLAASKDFDALEELYASASDFDGLAEFLGAVAERSSDPATKVELSFRAAHVYESRLGEPQRAFRNYERILSVDPHDVRAARALVPIYERNENWARLAQVLETLLEHTPDEDRAERLQLVNRLASLYQDRLRVRERAFEHAARAYRMAPEREDVRERLRATAESASRLDELVALYRERVPGASPEEAVSLRRRIAVLVGERLGRVAEAAAELDAIVLLRPRDREALDALERIHRAEGHLDRLRGLFEHRIEHADDDDERVARLRELAAFEESERKDVASAIERHRALLELRPDDALAWAALDRLYEASARTQDLAATLERRIALAIDDAERRTLFVRLGKLRLEALGDPSGALESFEQAIDMGGTSPDVIAAVEAIERNVPKLAVEAGALLEPIYTTSGDASKLVALFRRRLESTDDDGEKTDLRLRIAELASDSLDDVATAYEMTESAFLDRPKELELWDRLAIAAERAERQEDLVKAYALALESGALDEALVVELSARTAEVFDVVLGRPEHAEPHHRRVLAHAPLDDAAFVALRELYTNHERFGDLESLYVGRLEASADPERRRELLVPLGFLYEELLDRPERAIDAYRAALETEPHDASVRRALDRLYRRTERYADLVALLEDELSDAVGHDVIDVAFELGQLYEARLENPERAVAHYERVLAESPTHLRAQESLERLFGVAEQRQRIASILEPLYESQGAWSEFARVLSVRLEAAEEAEARVGLLTRIAEVREQKLRDVDAAFAAMADATLTAPHEVMVRSELSRLASLRARPKELADVLERAASRLEDAPGARVEVLSDLAALYELELRDLDAAAAAHLRLLASAEDAPEHALASARALERVQTARGDHAGLARALRTRIEREVDPETQADLRRRLASLFEHELADVEHALAVHRERLEADPSDIDALRALERLHEARQEWAELVHVLDKHDAVATSDDERREVVARIADVYEHRLGDAARAIDAHLRTSSRFGAEIETLEPLARLYERTERWPALVETLEQLDALVADPTRRTDLRVRTAELRRRHLAEVERAVETYELVLAENPGEPRAIDALVDVVRTQGGDVRTLAARTLVPHLDAASRFDLAVEMLEVLGGSDDPAERLASLRRAAAVAELRLADVSRAFELSGRALREGVAEPEIADLLAEHRRLADAGGLETRYVESVRAVLPELLDAAVRIQAALDVAALASTRLDDTALARSLYEHVLEESPTHPGALDALELLYERVGDHRALFELVRRRGELAVDDADRTRLLLRQASLAEQKLGDDAAAVDALEQVLALGARRDAFDGLERLYTKAARPSELASLYDRELESGIFEAADVHYKLGSVYLGPLSDTFQAIEHFRRVLDHDPRHAGAVAELEKLMQDPEHRAIAAEILEPVYLARMDWPHVTAALEARIQGAGSEDERIALLRRLAKIQEEYLEDLEAALETYARLFEVERHNAEILDAMHRIARVLGNWERVVAIQSNVLAQVAVDDSDSARLAFQTAQLAEERTRDFDKAVALYRRALAFDTSDDAAFESLERVLTRQGAHEAVLELYRDQVDVASLDARRVELLHKAAKLERDVLRDVPRAVTTLERVLEIDPAEREATTLLDALYAAEGRWTDLAEHLRRQIDLARGGDAETGLTYRLGVVLADKIGDRSGAIDVFEELVQRWPDHEPTVRALELLVQDVEHRLRITRVLDPIYRRGGQWKKLVAIEEAQVELVEDRDERVRLLLEIGHLHESHGSAPEHAYGAFARAFVLDPESADARAEVERAASERGAFDAYVATYEEALSRVDEPMLSGELLRAIAKAHDERRGDPRSAILAWDRIAKLEPDSTEPLDALESLHTLVGDWDGLVDVSLRKAERAFDPVERADYLRRAASVLQDLLGQPRRAIDVYRAVLEQDPNDVPSLEALDALLEAEARTEELAEIVGRRAELELDAGARVELGLRLGELEEKALGRTGRAIEAYERVLSDEPHCLVALEALGRLYDIEGRARDLLDNLTTRYEIESAGERRVALAKRAAQVLEQRLDDRLAAVERYRDVLEQSAADTEAIDALLRLSASEETREAAIEIIEPRLGGLGRFDDLVRVLELRADASPDPYERRDLRRRVADVHEQERGDLDAAFHSMRIALTEDPSDETLVEALERLADKRRSYEPLADVLALRAGASTDPELAQRLYVRLGRVAEEKLNDLVRAIDAYTRALDAGGDPDSILSSLERLHTQRSDFEELAAVLERWLETTTDTHLRRDIHLKIARIRTRERPDQARALAAYRDVLDDDPADAEAIAGLDALVADPDVADEALDVLEGARRRSGSLEALAVLLETRARRATDPGESARYLVESARVLENELGDPRGALGRMIAAVERDPRDMSLLDEVERLALIGGSFEPLRGLPERLVGLAALEPDARRDLHLRAARWYGERLDDRAAAERELRAAIEADPESFEAHDSLTAALRGEGRDAELVAALRAFAEVDADPTRKITTLREAAELLESRVGDLEGAANTWLGVLAVDDGELGALDALARIRAAQNRPRDVVQLLGRRVDAEPDPQARLAFRHRIAELLESPPLADTDAAIEAYRAVLDEEPTDPHALDRLEALYEKSERHRDLAELLERRLDLALSDAERISFRVRLARLAERAFGERASALDQIRAILELEPEHAEAVDELVRLLRLEQRHDELVDVLEDRAARAMRSGATAREIAVLIELARVREELLGDTLSALEAYRRVLERDPGHLTAHRAAARLSEALGDVFGAADAYESLAERSSGDDAVEAWRAVARLSDAPLDDAERAERALRRALELTPDHHELRGELRAFLSRRARHDGLANVLEQDVLRAADAATRVELLRQLAELRRGPLGDPRGAAEALERAVAERPDDRTLLLPLVDLYGEAKRDAEAIPVLEKIVASFGGRRSKELAPYHHRLGRAFRAMGDTKRAIEQFDAAFKIDLTNVAILRDLGELSHELGDYERAQKTFRALLLQKLDASAGIGKADVYFYLGDASAKQGDRAKAISMLERALAEQPGHSRASELLATLRG